MDILDILREQNIEELKKLKDIGLDISIIKFSLVYKLIDIKEPNIDFFQFLIDNGADTNEEVKGKNILYYIVEKYCRKAIHKYDLTHKYKKYIYFLIKNNIKIEEVFVLVTMIGDIEIIEYLIDNGVNINIDIDTEEGISLFNMILMMNEKLLCSKFKQTNDLGLVSLLSEFDKRKVKIIEIFIKNGIDINNETVDNIPLIYFACLFSEIEIIELFIKNGIDINKETYKDMPLIYWACLFSEIEIIELLIDNGANINIDVEDGISLFSIVLMMNKKLLELILFNQKDSFDISLLFSNFEKNKMKIAKLFIENCIDINKERVQGKPLLQMCCINRDILFNNHEEMSIKEKEIFNTFMNSFFLGDIQIAKFLLDNGANVNIKDSNNMTLLQMAYFTNNFEMIKLLCEYGADVNIQDIDNWTPLIGASRKGDEKIVKLLLEYGADVNIQDINNWTPLIEASRKGNEKTVKLLLEYGADVNIQNINNWTPLIEASSEGHYEVVELLLKYGADIHLETNENFNAGDMAFNKKIEKLLYKCGLKESSFIINHRLNPSKYNNKDNKLEFHTKELERLKEESEQIKLKFKKEQLKENRKFLKRINIKKTPMTIVLETRDTAELKKLINSGYDTSFVDIYDLILSDYPFEFIQLILENGGNPNFINRENNLTPIFNAISCDNLEVVKLLILYGANVNFKSINKEFMMTPLFIAVVKGNLEIVMLLVQYGANTTIKIEEDKEIWEYALDKPEILDVLLNPFKYFQKESHQPKKLINILTNFTIDTPIKYSTHLWDFSSLKEEYTDFKGFINEIDKQWRVIGKELKELSPKLHEKIYNFLLNDNPTKSWCSKADITVGWSSLDGLEEWCNKGKNPFDFELKESIEVDNQTIATFGEVITLFKKEIEIRNDSNMLENIFLAQKRKLGRAFKMELIKLKGRSFYTDVESFQNAIDRLFQEIQKRKEHKEIKVEVVEPDAQSIEIVITQIDSKANRDIKEMVDEVEDGDFKMLKESLTNLCDWSIESDSENGGYRVNYLSESTQEKSKKLVDALDGFKHILRFYKK